MRTQLFTCDCCGKVTQVTEEFLKTPTYEFSLVIDRKQSENIECCEDCSHELLKQFKNLRTATKEAVEASNPLPSPFLPRKLKKV